MNKHILYLFPLLFLLFSFSCSDDAIFKQEAHFSQFIFFGDSLSDTGNGACTEEPRTELTPVSFELRRVSNGLLAVEHLANSLFLPLSTDANPSFHLGRTDFCSEVTSGSNYAVIGALAAGSEPKDLLSQVDNFFLDSGFQVDRDALYVFFIGGNDLIAASQNPSIDESIIDNAISNISQKISLLKSGGARNFLVVLAPNIGKTPLMIKDPDPNLGVTATNISITFNARLQTSLRRLDDGRNQIKMFDLFGFMNSLLDSGTFANIIDECVLVSPLPVSCTSTGIFPGADFDTSYFFWDDRHPTATVHRLLGNALTACYGIGSGSTDFCIN